MSTPLSPQHVRVPNHLSDASLRQALDELDGKIKTLRNRTHATAAGAPHTYHEHIAALETKRQLLLDRLGPSPAADKPDDAQDRSAWDEIWRGIENLRNDLRNII